jgi:hypothetical protein
MIPPTKNPEDVKVLFPRSAEILNEYQKKLKATKLTPEEFDQDMGAAMLKTIPSVNCLDGNIFRFFAEWLFSAAVGHKLYL